MEIAESDRVVVRGVVIEGYRIASGTAANGPYPRGSIDMQRPFFERLGLDLTGFFPATLNVSVQPLSVVLYHPRYTFPAVRWSPNHPAEDFSFSPCQVMYRDRAYDGLVYYPHPETKPCHYQDPSTVEIITRHLPGIAYGDAIDLVLDAREMRIEEG